MLGRKDHTQEAKALFADLETALVPWRWLHADGRRHRRSPLTDPASAPKQGDEGAPEAWIVFDPRVLPAIKASSPATKSWC